MPNRLDKNYIYRGQLYTPDSPKVPQGLYDLLEEAGNIEPVIRTAPDFAPDYDGMNVEDSKAFIETLDDRQKRTLLSYEQNSKNRKSLVEMMGGVWSEPEPAPTPAAATQPSVPRRTSTTAATDASSASEA